MYNRILIANRGEIALRIIRACREMGIETVAVFSEGDRGSQYLELADESYCIGNARSNESYLRIDQIISAAEVSGAEAIHPGYGFLAENAQFNEVCRDCEIDFIGPSPEAMQMLGDKNDARALANKANVPVVPGSDGLVSDDTEALRVAPPHSETPVSISKSTSRIRVTSRFRSWPTDTATSSICGNATAPRNDGTRN